MIAGQAHLAWAPDAGNAGRHAYVSQAIKCQAAAILVAQQIRPECLPVIQDILDGGFVGVVAQARATASDTPARSEQEWSGWVFDKAGAAFSDVGPNRTIVFHVLGVRWTIHGRNDQDTVLAMEDFMATLQILLVEFASLDPVLISEDVDVEIRTYPSGHGSGPDCRTRMESELRMWLLLLPAVPAETGDSGTPSEALQLAFQVLIGHSLLDHERFSSLMDQAAHNGLFHNLEIGRPYRELALFRTEPESPQWQRDLECRRSGQPELPAFPTRLLFAAKRTWSRGLALSSGSFVLTHLLESAGGG